MISATDALRGRDFLSVADWSREELLEVLDLADRLKEALRERREHRLLPDRAIGLLFEKPSLRTRVSFEVGIAQLGAQPVQLPGKEIGLGEREPVRDMAHVLSRYLDALMIRTFAQSLVELLAEHASIPVINGLTDVSHPCQALADAMTIREQVGRLEGTRVAYVGDGNNVCSSLMVICAKLRLEFAAATPPRYEPAPAAVAAARAAGGEPRLLHDPREAAAGADVVYTDVWTSMGQEAEREPRLRDFDGYCVDAPLVAAAAPNAVVLHCLPAHHGEEISTEVLFGPRSRVWDQAENRLHAQKALLALIVE
jgi:ornithine carbamoyltransferase